MNFTAERNEERCEQPPNTRTPRTSVRSELYLCVEICDVRDGRTLTESQNIHHTLLRGGSRAQTHTLTDRYTQTTYIHTHTHKGEAVWGSDDDDDERA